MGSKNFYILIWVLKRENKVLIENTNQYFYVNNKQLRSKYSWILIEDKTILIKIIQEDFPLKVESLRYE